MWNRDNDPKCHKCGAPGTLKHILSACPKSLASGMYTWQHNQVLEEFRDVLKEVVVDANEKVGVTSGQVTKIHFHEEGEYSCGDLGETKCGIMFRANDWKLMVDLDNKALFPVEVASTTMRPDIVLWLVSTMLLVIAELTVPWEENISVANVFKSDKYTELIMQCRDNGYKVRCYPIEIGCRGYASRSLTFFLNQLGIRNKLRKKLVQGAVRRASKAST